MPSSRVSKPSQKLVEQSANKKRKRNEADVDVDVRSCALLCTECEEAASAEQDLHCSTCGCLQHRKCVSLPQSFVPRSDWECIECRLCTICGSKDQPESLLFCDLCDRATHLKCWDPSAKRVPTGSWICLECSEASNHQQSRSKHDASYDEKKRKQEVTEDTKLRRAARYEERVLKINDFQDLKLGHQSDLREEEFPIEIEVVESSILEDDSSHLALAELDVDPNLMHIKSSILSRLFAKTELHVPQESEWLSAKEELHALLKATCLNGEGNSVLLQGQRSGGKTFLFHQAIQGLSCKVVKLDGNLQISPTLAMQSLARQLKSCVNIESVEESLYEDISASNLLPILSSTKGSVVILLENAENFANVSLHPRQALLYVLLDLAQSGQRAGGLCIVCETSAVDFANTMEKRVRSRFSQRVVQVPLKSDHNIYMKNILSVENQAVWNESIENLFQDTGLKEIVHNSLQLHRDLPTLHKTWVCIDLMA